MTEQEYWDRQTAAMQLLSNNPSTYFGQFGPSLFMPPKSYIVTCMDDRVIVPRGVGRLAFAGSTVLQDSTLRAITAEKVRKHRLPVTGVTRHKGCGAESLAEAEGMNPATIAQQAPSLAEMLGTDFMGMAEMLPISRHVARGMLVTGVRHFDVSRIQDQLNPLLISERYSPTAAREAVIGTSVVAFSEHNHRSDFSRSNPFFVWIIGQEGTKKHRWEQIRDRLFRAHQEDDRAAAILPNIEFLGYDVALN